jgi:hypothetical protein
LQAHLHVRAPRVKGLCEITASRFGVLVPEGQIADRSGDIHAVRLFFFEDCVFRLRFIALADRDLEIRQRQTGIELRQGGGSDLARAVLDPRFKNCAEEAFAVEVRPQVGENSRG